MSAIDYEEAIGRFDGDEEIYLELIETFLDSPIADFSALRVELAAGDVKQVAFRAHKLKGAALTLGGNKLAGIAGTLETALRERFPEEILSARKTGALKPGEYCANVDELESIYRETVAELRSIQNAIQTRR